MAITQWINLQIKVSNSGVARQGFGVPLILSHKANGHAGWAPGFVHSYSGAADVLADGFAASSPEYLAAAAIFAQQPHPTKVMIGRCASSVSMVWVISVKTVTDSHKYQVQVDGEGVTSTLATFTSGVGTTNDLIVAGLVTQLNNVVGKNYTAAATGSVGSQVVTVTATAAGDWNCFEVIDPAYLGVKQTTADPGIATDLANIALEDNTWYAIVTLYTSHDYALAVAAYAETNSKEYAFDTNDTDAISTALANGDTLDAMATHGYTHTIGNWHHSPKEFLSASALGRLMPLNPGLWVWFGKTLAGPTPSKLNTTQRNHLIDRRAGAYTFEGDRSVTWDGKVGSTLYQFIDVAVSLDWFANDVVSAIAGVLFGNDKIDYTDEGIQKIAAAIRGSVARAVSDEHKVLAPGDPTNPDPTADPVPTVSFPKVADIDPSQRALRNLPNGTITARLAGAIQTVGIIATVTF